MSVKYPRLLDSSGNIIRRIEPVSGSLDLQLDPLSSAELELQPGDSIPERSWVAVYTEYGLAGIFRSKPQRDRYGERSTSVSLVHGACELNDYLTGKADEAQAPANTAISAIFAGYKGSMWQLGTVSPTASVIYSLSNSGVLDAIVDVMEQLPGYMITFDQTTLPWTLNVVERPSTVTAEGRLSRNIQSVEISRDDSNLCTKVYFGEGNDYVEDIVAEEKYGIIEHRISESGYTSQQLYAIADAYLESHKAPKLSVTISAIDLSQITGEPLDQITIGRKYRLTMPDAETEENRVIEQIVCSVRYDDLFGNPNPQITLASDPDTIITFLKKQRRGGAAAKEAAKEEAEKQYNHWVTENDQYRRSVYKIMGVMYDNNGNVIYQVDPETGEIMYDEAGNPIPVYWPESGGSIAGQITQSAQNLQTLYEKTGVNNLGTLETLYSRITQEAERITTEVTRATAAEESLSSRIQQEADKIGLVVEKKNGQDVVKRSAIVAAINEDSESTVTISADKIDLEGYVTADEIFATDATIGKYLKANNLIVTTKIKTAELEATNGASIESGLTVSDGAVIGGGLIADAISLGTATSSTPLGDAIKEITLTGPDTNDMYTLSAVTLGGTAITIGNFSRAASPGQATVLNGVWGGSTYTVTAAPQGETWTINFDPQTTSDDTWATEIGTGSVNVHNSKWLDFPLYIGKYNQSGPMTRSVTINRSIDASLIYNNGWGDAVSELAPPPRYTGSGEQLTFSVSIPSSTVGSSDTYDFTIDKQTPSSTGYAYVNCEGTLVGRISVGNYYTSGQDSVAATFTPYSGTPGTTEELDPGTYEFKIVKGSTTTTDLFYTVPSAPAPIVPKVSKGTWSNGSLTFTAGTTGDTTSSVKIWEGATDGSLDSATTPTKISFDVYEDTGNNTKTDTGANIYANVTRSSASLSLGTYDSTNHKFTVSKSSGGSVTVGNQVIQVGVTALDIPVTTGSNVIGDPSYQGDGVYTLAATGTITVGNQNLTVSGTDTFTATDAVDHGKQLAAESLSVSPTTQTQYNQSQSAEVYIESNGYYFVNIGETAYKKFHAPATGVGVTYVVSSSGEPINVYNGLSLIGRLYPNTDVVVGSQTDGLGRRQITYGTKSGYVNASSLSNTKGPTNHVGRIGWTSEGGGIDTRTVLSLSNIVLEASDAGNESIHSVDVVYSDGNTVLNGATVTVDATAISGGGGDVDHIAKSGNVSYSDDFKTVYFNATAYDSGNTALHTNQVSANISEAWENGRLTGRAEVAPYAIQSGRSVTITSNTGSGGMMVYPETIQGQHYDAMDAVKVIVDVPSQSVDHIRKSGTATFSASYKTVYFDVTAYNSATESASTSMHTNQVSADITKAFNEAKSAGWSEGYKDGQDDFYPVSKTEIDIPTPGTSGNPYSNIDKKYTISKNDKYVLIRATVRGETKRIQLTLA